GFGGRWVVAGAGCCTATGWVGGCGRTVCVRHCWSCGRTVYGVVGFGRTLCGVVGFGRTLCGVVGFGRTLCGVVGFGRTLCGVVGFGRTSRTALVVRPYGLVRLVGYAGGRRCPARQTAAV